MLPLFFKLKLCHVINYQLQFCYNQSNICLYRLPGRRLSAIQSLPVSDYLINIASQLKNSRKLVLTAEPGAGKSTLVPLHLLNESWLQDKKILMLEPRRVAAKSLAQFLAKQLEEQVGQTVGYRVKNDSKTSVKTRLEIVTEGILTRQIQQDPELAEIGLIIFDEFHERNLHSDLGLMLVKDVIGSLRDDLRVLVMSATIDSDLISHYLIQDRGEAAPVLHCPGRAYPVHVTYRSAINRNVYGDPLPQQVYSAVLPFFSGSGDILVFLPGQGEIKRCIRFFEEKASDANLLLVPLYGGLPLEHQQQALQPDNEGRRRVIFSTNIAETSLTIEGVSVVVDSGLERQMLFDAKTGMSRLETVAISSASATQRAGRAGRLGPGNCVRLWSESKQLPEYQPEEIKVTDISQMLIDLAEWGQTNFASVDWITPPPESHYDRCITILTLLGFMDEQGKLTKQGKKASKLPLSPRLAAIYLAAQSPQEIAIACDLCALLSEKDLLNRFHSADFSYRLQALWTPNEFKRNLNFGVLQQVQQTAQRLRKSGIKPRTGEHNTSSEQTFLEKTEVAAELLLHGYPDVLAKSRKQGQNKYLLHNGRGAELNAEDNLCQQSWLLVLDINARAINGVIWLAMPVSEKSVLAFTESQLDQQERIFWDEKSGAAKAIVTTNYGAIVIDEQVSARLTREQKQQLLLQQIQEQGLTTLNWTKKCDTWLKRVSWLSHQALSFGVKDFPQLNPAALCEKLDEWLLPFMGSIETLAQLKKLDILPLLTSTLDWQQQQQLDTEAPETFITPSGKSVLVHYDSQQGPMISVQLQELFGLTQSPKLAFGNVPLRFEMLSPARRPIQTTSDLAGFWQSSYFDIAKEMRGRYPKHRWPDNPLEEKAGKSIKRRV